MWPAPSTCSCGQSGRSTARRSRDRPLEGDAVAPVDEQRGGDQGADLVLGQVELEQRPDVLADEPGDGHHRVERPLPRRLRQAGPGRRAHHLQKVAQPDQVVPAPPGGPGRREVRLDLPVAGLVEQRQQRGLDERHAIHPVGPGPGEGHCDGAAGGVPHQADPLQPGVVEDGEQVTDLGGGQAVVGGKDRFGALVAAQDGQHHPVPGRQVGSDPAEGPAAAQRPVQQHDRRALAGDLVAQLGTVGGVRAAFLGLHGPGPYTTARPEAGGAGPERREALELPVSSIGPGVGRCCSRASGRW